MKNFSEENLYFSFINQLVNFQFEFQKFNDFCNPKTKQQKQIESN